MAAVGGAAAGGASYGTIAAVIAGVCCCVAIVVPTTIVLTKDKTTTTVMPEIPVTTTPLFDMFFNDSIVEMSCVGQEIDLAFLVDGSGSVKTANFDIAKQFVKNIVEPMDISATTSRVAFIQFADSVTEEFSWNSDKNSTLASIDSVVYKKERGTKTGKGLNFVKNNVFGSARASALKFLVVMTDGKSHDMPVPNAEDLRKSGVVVFSIGLTTGADFQEVEEMASSPSSTYFHSAPTFEALDNITSYVTKTICETPKPIVEICKSGAIDLTFLVDGSGSVTEPNFKKSLDFIENIVTSLDISATATRVNFIQFSDTTNNEFDWQTDKTALISKIKAVSYLQGGTKTGKALDVVRSQLSNKRLNADAVLVVLTDGKSNDEPTMAANRLRDLGVKIFTIGVGSPDEDEIKSIASTPSSNFVFMDPSFDALEKIQKSVTKLICEIPKTLEEICKDARLDVTFIVDSSGSMREDDFEYVKSFIDNIIDPLPVPATRISVVNYGENATSHIDFTNDQTMAVSEVYGMDKIDGLTNTGKALDFYINQVLPTAEPNSAKVVVLITDGPSTDSVATQSAQLKKLGVYSFSIGLDDPNSSQLNSIASRSENVYIFPEDDFFSFSLLDTIEYDLTKKMCLSSPPIECKNAEIDVLFLVDGSGSVTAPNFSSVFNGCTMFQTC
jgi:uncharacterized protein with von Willebrand factor type A (vWA) domain